MRAEGPQHLFYRSASSLHYLHIPPTANSIPSSTMGHWAGDPTRLLTQFVSFRSGMSATVVTPRSQGWARTPPCLDVAYKCGD